MATPTATVLVDARRTTGVVDDRVYGQFLENMGRAIYGGVFEPGSALADADGYRTDVLGAARELAPPVLRWPGGNFASGYHWRDGIGPPDDRPARFDLAWSTLEPNRFGTEEFLAYAQMLGSTTYLNLNASTGTIDEWGVWPEPYLSMAHQPEVINRRLRAEVGPPVHTEPAPMIEYHFDLKDALAHATWLHVLWRHPEKVSLATQAQMVNVLGPIFTTPDGVVRQTTFHPLAVARRFAQGTGLDVEVITDAGLEAAIAPGGGLSALDAAGTCDPATGRTHLSLVNRLPDDEMLVNLDGIDGPAQRITLWADDPAAANTPEEPNRVVPTEEQCENPLAAPVPAGGAVVFSSLTPHLTGPNTTDGVRKAYILQYAPAGAELLTGDPTQGPPTGRVPCDAPERQYAVTRSGAPVTPYGI